MKNDLEVKTGFQCPDHNNDGYSLEFVPEGTEYLFRQTTT